MAPSSTSVQVPNQGLREAFLEGDESISVVCMRLGIKHDHTHIERVLGLKPDSDSGKFRTTISEELGVKLCEALCVDPHEVGF